MLEEFQVKNYKSIKECSIELGRFNVFIGENGCGKSNILEAVAMFSLATSFSESYNIPIDTESLYNRGVRVNTPKQTINAFKRKNKLDTIDFKVKQDGVDRIEVLSCENKEDIYSHWKRVIPDEIKIKKFEDINFNNLKSNIEKEVLLQFQTTSEKEKSKEIINTLFGDTNNLKKFIKHVFYEDEFSTLKDFLIYNLETKFLRGISKESLKQPLGINGEGLDVLISNFDKKELSQLLEYSKFISWLDNIVIDNEDIFKHQGHKLGKSTSSLYFKDKFMSKKNNIFSAENANEGILHIIFYLALFISKRTPKFFAIDNIEKSLNPKLCRNLIKELVKIAKENDKQALITTHNPAILDGLNLNDDEQRLFVVSRSDEGYTQVERIKVKPNSEEKYKLSEMWMRGYLGGIPNNF